MSKRNVERILKHACKKGMTEVERLEAELDMAIGIMTAQKFKIVSLESELKDRTRNEKLGPTIRHYQD